MCGKLSKIWIRNYRKGRIMTLPNKNENKKEYIERFMSNNKMVERYPDEDQRYAIAISHWEDKNKN